MLKAVNPRDIQFNLGNHQLINIEINERINKQEETILDFYIVQVKDKNGVLNICYNDYLLVFSEKIHAERFILFSKNYLSNLDGSNIDELVEIDIRIIKLRDINYDCINSVILADGLYIDILIKYDLFNKNSKPICYDIKLYYIADKIQYHTEKVFDIGSNIVILSKDNINKYEEIKSFLLTKYPNYTKFINYSEFFENDNLNLELLDNIINIINMIDIPYEKISKFLKENNTKIIKKCMIEGKICVFIMKENISGEYFNIYTFGENLIYNPKISSMILYFQVSLTIFINDYIFVIKSRNLKRQSIIEIDQLI